ncbi:MAG: hypothetical protein KBA33_09315 [Cloacibacterium sp.]|nr:hypothetical protein [Cloacibacterium sp.]
MATKQEIYGWFQTGDFPTEAQFRATWDSFWHRDESISMSSILGLNAALNNTVSTQMFNSYTAKVALYMETFAKSNAENIDVPMWRLKLGITEQESNVIIDLTQSLPQGIEVIQIN